MSRFTRITGIPILNILDLTLDGVVNVIIAEIITKIKSSVNQGRGMVEPMKTSGMFLPAVVQMVTVGEMTGKIDQLLLRVADYYDTQVDYIVNNLLPPDRANFDFYIRLPGPIHGLKHIPAYMEPGKFIQKK